MARIALGIVLLCAAGLTAAEPNIYPAAKHGQGELKIINGIPVAILQGTPEEIGTQYGELILKPALPLVSTIPEFLKEMKLANRYPELLKMGTTLIDHASDDFRVEITAAAKTAGIDTELLLFSNTLADIYKLGGCSTVVVEAKRSKTGHPIFGRNFDWPPYKNLGDHTCVIVYRPKGKHAYASIHLPPCVGIISGMNDAGLCLTMNEIMKSADETPTLDTAGVPLTFIYRTILEECTTVDEAEARMRKFKRPTAAAITLCDRKSGAVLEITPKNVMVRRGMEGITCCTNHFRCDGLATSMECKRYRALEPLQKADGPMLGVPEVAKELQKVSQWVWTMQSMVFEPEPLRLHLSYATGSSAAWKPMKQIDLAPLFGK